MGIGRNFNARTGEEKGVITRKKREEKEVITKEKKKD